MPKHSVTLFRHGEARYEQGHTSLNEASDLTTHGRIDIETSSKRFLASLANSGQKLLVYSSPYGRTIESAQIIIDQAAAVGMLIQQHANSELINLQPDLEEVRYFNPKLLASFVFGGNFESNGQTYIADPKITNPNSYTSLEYFNEREWANLDRDTLPLQILEAIDELHTIERALDIKTRSIQAVSKIIASLQDTIPPLHILLVTHQEVIWHLTEGKSVDPAAYIKLI